MSQNAIADEPDGNKKENVYFASLNLGVQMSGIKSEDFIRSNYSPLLSFAWQMVLSWISYQFGYKGWYFNTISDDIKHPYTYLYGEAIFNITDYLKKYLRSKNWNLNLHMGSGYFYNYDYDQPNICANLTISNQFQIADKLLATISISAIIGWDIYQGDEDILPGISTGITYLF